MSIEKHDLVHELPEYKEKIHQLKIEDRHFAKLFDEYHEVDHEIHRLEMGIENSSDAHVESRKKQRLHLKDQMVAMLKG